MVDPSSGLQRDDLVDYEDPEFEWTEEDYLQFEEESREMAAQMQEVPSWSSLFFEHSEWVDQLSNAELSQMSANHHERYARTWCLFCGSDISENSREIGTN